MIVCLVFCFSVSAGVSTQFCAAKLPSLPQLELSEGLVQDMGRKSGVLGQASQKQTCVLGVNAGVHMGNPLISDSGLKSLISKVVIGLLNVKHIVKP